MVGNKYVDRSVSPPRYIDTSDAGLLRKLDLESGGRLMSAATLGETLASSGRSLAVLATNTPGTTRFFHHKAGQNWITSAFLEVVWPKCRPDVTILSYGEPDTTSHFHGTGGEGGAAVCNAREIPTAGKKDQKWARGSPRLRYRRPVIPSCSIRSSPANRVDCVSTLNMYGT